MYLEIAKKKKKKWYNFYGENGFILFKGEHRMR